MTTTPTDTRAADADGAGATTTAWTVTPTDLGLLLVAATDRGVCFVQLGDDPDGLEARMRAELPDALLVRDDVTLRSFVDAVLERVAGDPAPTDIPLDVAGTAFQQRVWEALLRIPRGEVRTYGEIAAAIGSPRAVRAVGTACASNPVGLVVPCHRVVPKSGGVGSYGFGPARKRELLRREGASVAEPDHHATRRLELD